MTGVQQFSLAAAIFFVGSALGSFLNVCLYRIPAGLSLFHPPSRCPRCGTGVAIRDNVPILGWIRLGGRCRHCTGAISIRYPLVEFLCGALPAAAYLLRESQSSADLLEMGPVAIVLTLSLYLLGSIAMVSCCFATYDSAHRHRVGRI